MHRQNPIASLGLLVIVIAQTLLGQSPPRPTRALTVDDLLAVQELGAIQPSPDGQSIAVVISRPRIQAGAGTYLTDGLGSFERDDIWLLARDGTAGRNLTRGDRSGAGYWAPMWSPDGKRLALLSTLGGDNVRPYLWDKRTGRLQRLSERGVPFSFTSVVLPDGTTGPLVWLNATEVLCVLWPTGVIAAPLDGQVATRNRAPLAWRQETQGLSATASVLESGRDDRVGSDGIAHLVRINVVTGTTTTVAEIPIFGGANVQRIVVSPRRHFVAIVAATSAPIVPPATSPFRWEDAFGRVQIGVTSLEHEQAIRWVRNVAIPVDVDQGLMTVTQWSPDERWIAVTGRDSINDSMPPSVYLVARSNPDTARRLTPDGLASSDIVWVSDSTMVIRMRPAPGPQSPLRRLTGGARTTSSIRDRSDWWEFRARDSARDVVSHSVTASMDTVPSSLMLSGDGHLIGLVAGTLWSLDPDRGVVTSLGAAGAPRLRRIVRVAHPTRDGYPLELVAATGDQDGAADTLYVVDVTRAAAVRARRLDRPSPTAYLQSYLPASGLTLFLADSPLEGPVLFATGPSGTHCRILASLNTHLTEVASPKRMLISYRSADGDSLHGLLVLPIDYRAGTRYPMITWVYAGHIQTDTADFGAEKYFGASLNLQLLTAHGYVVLIPSMPLVPQGIGSDPYIDLPKGVLSAVDKAIDLGIADPDRLGLMGHSYGGYSTYTLVTYTHRFKAAVALAGSSDLVSLYGTFAASSRYDEVLARAAVGDAPYFEGGQGRMGASPQGNLWRYLRNSPVFFADRVETPLLIIQGDMDGVAMQQGEEFFTALWRQKKPARFVRFWGEGHWAESPPNVRRQWHELYDWFDTLLGVTPRSASGGTYRGR